MFSMQVSTLLIKMKLFLNRNVIVENYMAPTMAQPIDEIDDIANSISDNIAKEV
jgi:hypothetical protein